MRALIAAEKGEETDEVLDTPLQFNHEVSYVIRTWLEHKLHHLYPEQGGYNDQDPLLLEDWATLNLYYVRAEKGVFTLMPQAANPGHWLDLMGG